MKRLLFFIAMFVMVLGTFAVEYRTFKGEVSEFKKGVTRLYKVNGISVGRGAERYVRDYIGKVVELVCVIKNNKIVRIKSSKPVGFGADKTSNISLVELSRMYTSNRSETVKKYRDREITISATITSISVKSAQQYQLSLSGSLGRIHIDKFELPETLRKSLFAQNELKNGRKNVTFKGKWVGNQGTTLIFREITSIR
ncbi:MAG: hypothetical protein MK132_21495 [Lentisphaerales bacterium]|nr:hypothetical protein [Lentisphaerales bacterium]